jgi:arsenite-transporting ATPase
MTRIVTFLGKGGIGCSTVAIALAKKYALQGSRVLLVGQDPSPVWGMLLGVTPTGEPQELGANLKAVQLASPHLLERGWEEVKQLEAKYLRSPLLKQVYGEELTLLPGMDGALALKQIWEYQKSGQYDLIVYDGTGDLGTVRLLGTPESLSWYLRRFRQVIQNSDFYKALSPFIAPITGALLNVTWNPDSFAQEPTEEANQLLTQAQQWIGDPARCLVYLVTNNDPTAIAMAQYLWGSTQVAGATVGGVLVNQGAITDTLRHTFAPLPLHPLPTKDGDRWAILSDALPHFPAAGDLPKPLAVDVAQRQVKVFLPGFDKKQVKLIQSGPEITIEAGNQRRNIFLPPQLAGQPVRGAKFQEGYLIISL